MQEIFRDFLVNATRDKFLHDLASSAVDAHNTTASPDFADIVSKNSMLTLNARILTQINPFYLLPHVTPTAKQLQEVRRVLV